MNAFDVLVVQDIFFNLCRPTLFGRFKIVDVERYHSRKVNIMVSYSEKIWYYLCTEVIALQRVVLQRVHHSLHQRLLPHVYTISPVYSHAFSEAVLPIALLCFFALYHIFSPITKWADKYKFAICLFVTQSAVPLAVRTLTKY
jgi:hypothetical protein